MSNYQKYYDEEEKQLKDIVSAQVAQRRQGDDAAKTQYAQGIDTAAQTASDQYRQRIDQAPTLFQERYDANHINELVGRKKVQEGMANMGLTDSGLNRSQQTALAVQRGNADAAARRQQQDYVTAAQAAIDKIMAEAETKKQQYGASLDQATNNWATDAALSASQTAATNATARVNTETEAETERIKAQYDALEKQAQTRLGLLTDADNPHSLSETEAIMDYLYGTGGTENQNPNNVPNYSALYMEGKNRGYSDEEAKLFAENGGGEVGAGAVEETAAKVADELTSGFDLDITKGVFGIGTTWGTAFNNQDGDGKIVAQKANKMLLGTPAFAALSPVQQKQAKAAIVAKIVKASWAKPKQANDNLKRIEVACENIGADYETALGIYNNLK